MIESRFALACAGAAARKIGTVLWCLSSAHLLGLPFQSLFKVFVVAVFPARSRALGVGGYWQVDHNPACQYFPLQARFFLKKRLRKNL